MRLLLPAILLLVGCGNSSISTVQQVQQTQTQSQQIVYVENQSAYPDSSVSRFVQAMNIQLQRDFLPTWRINAICLQAPRPTQESLTLQFLATFLGHVTIEYVDQISGNHDARHGYVDYPHTVRLQNTTRTASHEILETLANPAEPCDPVGSLGYEIDGVEVCDFAYPAYFQPGSQPPFDQLHVIVTQGVPAPGDSNFDPNGGR